MGEFFNHERRMKNFNHEPTRTFTNGKEGFGGVIDKTLRYKIKLFIFSNFAKTDKDIL